MLARITPRRPAHLVVEPTPEPVQLPPAVARAAAAEERAQEGSRPLLAAAFALAGVALVGWRLFHLLRR